LKFSEERLGVGPRGPRYLESNPDEPWDRLDGLVISKQTNRFDLHLSIARDGKIVHVLQLKSGALVPASVGESYV
jgi:hypothetical protein